MNRIISHFNETTTSMPLFRSLVELIINYKEKINLSVVLMMLLLGSSCQKEPIIRFGFETEFGKKSHGLSIMNVSNTAKEISLQGEISLSEGEVLVDLINPTGERDYTIVLISPGSRFVNESFAAVPGNWKLRYRSNEGSGFLKLHLSMVNNHQKK